MLSQDAIGGLALLLKLLAAGFIGALIGLSLTPVYFQMIMMLFRVCL